jgi:hypothetical protein
MKKIMLNEEDERLQKVTQSKLANSTKRGSIQKMNSINYSRKSLENFDESSRLSNVEDKKSSYLISEKIDSPQSLNKKNVIESPDRTDEIKINKNDELNNDKKK